MNTRDATTQTGAEARIVLVNIVQNGSDRGVFVNGKLVLSADPSCGDDTSVVATLAETLTNVLNADLKEIDVPAHEDWTWNDIEQLVTSSAT